MTAFLKVPTQEEAACMMQEAERRNPGPWVQHSIYSAQAAGLIAARHPALDPARAYIVAYLHDIGRREGVSDMRHTLDGYYYLLSLGYDDAAQICLTHSFPLQNIHAGAGHWDCSPAELAFATDYLSNCEYSAYDSLVQLCDALALPSGFCLIEKRLVDVALRHGFNGCTIDKWKAILKIQREFEQVIGQSIYALLPGVVDNTFGTHLAGHA